MSHYEVLGVPAQSEYADIRSKYRAAILALHPDKASSLRGKLVEALNSTAPSSELAILPERKSAEVSCGSDSGVVDGGEAEDEVPNDLAKGDGDDEVSSRFVRVQEAWEVLRDPESRAAYDRALLAEQFASKLECLGGDLAKVVAEDICLEDMSVSVDSVEGGADKENAEFSYPCRCGDFYVISRGELCRVADEFARGRDASRQNQGRPGFSGRQAVSGLARNSTKMSEHLEAESSPNCVENFGGLVLPCQSCSLHVRIQDIIEIRNLSLFSSWIVLLLCAF